MPCPRKPPYPPPPLQKFPMLWSCYHSYKRREKRNMLDYQQMPCTMNQMWKLIHHLLFLTYSMQMEDPKHWKKWWILVTMDLNVFGTISIPYSPRRSWLDEVKNRCDTKRFTFYCPMCLKSCNKLGLDWWDFWKKGPMLQKLFFMCCKPF